jgi:hypothetical protein
MTFIDGLEGKFDGEKGSGEGGYSIHKKGENEMFQSFDSSSPRRNPKVKFQKFLLNLLRMTI